MTLTMKPKAREVGEPRNKPRVMTTPIADAKTPPALTSTTTPAGIAAHDPSAGPRPFFPDSFKKSIRTWLKRDMPWVEVGLPEDLLIARSLVQTRLYGTTLTELSGIDNRLSVRAVDKGLDALNDGDLIGTWTWEGIAAYLLQEQQEAKAPKKAKGKGTATPQATGELSEAVREAAQSAAVSPDKRPAPNSAKVLERAAQVDCNLIDRHPINRHPTQADVDARKESLIAEGQLEDCTVRKMPNGRYQMISGETRLLAARKVGWKCVRATVIECDDRTAARRVAIHNAERSDLNPIERAQLVESLCKPKEEGGPGFTREQAAADVGLKHPAAASNLVKLLRLPDVWQRRVASGELPESFARLIVPVADIPAVMKELDKQFKKQGFEGRSDLQRIRDNLLRNLTRSFARDYWVDGRGYGKCLLKVKDLDDETRDRLGIITITDEDGDKVEAATNVALFDKLHEHTAAALAQKRAARETKGANKEGPTKLSPEEQRRRTQQKNELFKLRIRNWRHRWLSGIIAASLTPDDEDFLRLLTWCIIRSRHWQVERHGHWVELIADAAKAAGGKWSKPTGYYAPADGALWTALASATFAKGAEHQSLDSAIRDFLCKALTQPDHDKKAPFVPYEVVEEIATRWSINLDDEWGKLVGSPTMELRPFFEIFTSDQLTALAKELGVDLAGAAKRSDMIARFVSPDTSLALPKCLQLTPPAAAKGKRGGK